MTPYNNDFFFEDIPWWLNTSPYLWSFLPRIREYLDSCQLGNIESPSSAYIEHPELVSIGKHCRIEHGAYIRGPCIIGDYCEIRHGAYIRGSVIVGNHCVVGHTTELKNCILLDYAKAAHFAFIGDSIIGRHVNIGAGVKCANLRLDHTEVSLRIHDEKVPSGLRKFGAIIGDRAQIGCNSVCNPGTLIGHDVLCGPNMTLSGSIKPNSRLTGRT